MRRTDGWTSTDLEIEKGLAILDDEKRRQKLRNWVDRDLNRRFAGRILAFDYEAACRWGAIAVPP